MQAGSQRCLDIIGLQNRFSQCQQSILLCELVELRTDHPMQWEEDSTTRTE
jgi:hypothetical protein